MSAGDSRGMLYVRAVITPDESGTESLSPLRSVKVPDKLLERLRYPHYSLRTEQVYVHWVQAFIRFRGMAPPVQLDCSAVEAFLSWLAGERGV